MSHKLLQQILAIGHTMCPLYTSLVLAGSSSSSPTLSQACASCTDRRTKAHQPRLQQQRSHTRCAPLCPEPTSAFPTSHAVPSPTSAPVDRQSNTPQYPTYCHTSYRVWQYLTSSLAAHQNQIPHTSLDPLAAASGVTPCIRTGKSTTPADQKGTPVCSGPEPLTLEGTSYTQCAMSAAHPTSTLDVWAMTPDQEV